MSHNVFPKAVFKESAAPQVGCLHTLPAPSFVMSFINALRGVHRSDPASQLDETQVRRFLDQYGSRIMRALRPYIGPALLRDLVAGNAITTHELDLIKNEMGPDDQVDKLLQFMLDPEKLNNCRKVLKKREEDYLEKMIDSFLGSSLT